MKKLFNFISKEEVEQKLPGVFQWYENVLEPKWEYVVFIVRRSYLLALLLEELSEKKLEDNEKTTFLTDAALILRCTKMARRYKETGKFPKILLCDDLLLHGRNINHLIDTLHRILCELLPNEDEERIRDALVEAIQIQVYIRAEGSILLYGRYLGKLSYIYKGTTKCLYKHSSNISELILQSGMANAGYIYSKCISAPEMEWVKASVDLQCTQYQNTTQYTYIRYVGKNIKKAILTVRFVKDRRGNHGYRVIPMVFLPNLDDGVTRMILERIAERMNSKDFRSLMDSLYRIRGKRSFNELLTLVLSNVLLYEFQEKYQFEIQKEEEQAECLKLARNYNFNTLRQAKNCLNEVLYTKLFTIKELTQMLDETIPEEFGFLEFADRNQDSQKPSREQIVHRIEDYFYDRGCEEEKKAIELTKIPYFMGARFSERAVRGCCFTLQQLHRGYSQKETTMSMAYFLQMMDAGIVSLSSYASKRMDVVGFAQLSKAGEQSLLINPLRVYEYIPLLSAIQKECDRWGINWQRELERYCRAVNTGFDDEEKRKMIQFVQTLESMEQKVADWDEDYTDKKHFEDSEQKAQFEKRRQAHKENYLKYLSGS